MPRPTDDKIEAEIKRLAEIKPQIPAESFFGDSNWEQIEAQIRVLAERMDEDTVIATFEDADDPQATYDLVESAQEAREWLEGESQDGPPSKGWEPLIRK